MPDKERNDLMAKISKENLEKYITDLFHNAGATEEGAAVVAEILTKAELRGITSHGVSRIPNYMERVERKLVDPDPEITVTKETPTTAHVDGGYGLGQIVAQKAMELAIEKAKATGIGIVSVNKSHHFGIAAHYAEMAAKENMIGFATSNVTALMAPPGGASKAIGNNPLAYAFPAGKHLPVIFDMACSAVAQGKLIVADMNHKPIPEGWAVDINGVPTTDPAEGLKGFLLPAAGPKGYGLAVSMEILAGVLSGAAVAKNLPSIRNDMVNKQNCGHLFVAIDIDAIDDVEAFKERMDKFIDEMKEGKKATGSNEIFMPGEIELKKEIAARENGIDIPDGTFGVLQQIGEKYNVVLTTE